MRILNEEQSLYIIWATILNQSQDSVMTLEKTYELLERLNLFNGVGANYRDITLDRIKKVMKKEPMIHRFPNKMSQYLYLSLKYIIENFAGRAENVFDFNNRKDINFVERLILFKGIGVHKAEITSEILNQYLSMDYDSNYDKLILSCPSISRTIKLELSMLDFLAKKSCV